MVLDHILLLRIVGICDEMSDEMQRFGTDIEDFMDDISYQKIAAFNIVQIGETVKRLSPDLKEHYGSIPWSDIAGMRDYMAHKYHHKSLSDMWLTINDDFSELKRVCNTIIADIESGRFVPKDDD